MQGLFHGIVKGKAENGVHIGPPGDDFCEGVPREITALELIPGFRGFPGNGVRSCSSDPPKHAQESQDDVSSQQTPSNKCEGAYINVRGLI